MFRRHLITSVLLTAVVAVFLGLVYPLVVTGIGQTVFRSQANGSFITHNGQAIGSKLIGQNFLDSKGNPDPRYFQSRPSAAGNGYDPQASGATNLGPSDPRLVGFIPGFNTLDLHGNPSADNPFANPSDPYCVPTDSSGKAVYQPSDGQQYAMNPDGTYACYSSTVPERTYAYRQLNNLGADVKVPVDAVTASASGLDPGISVANAMLQAPRVAQSRNLSVDKVVALLNANTTDPQLGFMGEKTVNVLELNLALDNLSS
ncbi:MAG TPA: potassium-transporting ATPase subunit C [Acidimicrobiales bacterium]|jgi:K+-transporting ATPase ATPase C chain|nr:potassium-transporting ATPase subunit C [Acidimicrobiales bacterium]